MAGDSSKMQAEVARAQAHAVMRSSEPSALLAGQQIPDMEQISDQHPPLISLGAPGTSFFAGIIGDSGEYNEDFHWRDAVLIYDQMLRGDAVPAMIREAVEQPILAADWTIKPGSDDPADAEIASFVETCLFHELCYETSTGRKLEQSFAEVLAHILLHVWYGFTGLETCYRMDGEWVKWARFTPLLPRTFYKWWVGPDTELEGIQQYTFLDYHYAYVDIPADKLLLFSHRREGNNYEGVSVLRACYKHWWFVQQFEKIQAVGIEREAASFPVVFYPEGVTEDEKRIAQKFSANMRVNEQMGGALPNTWDVRYPEHQAPFQAAVENAIDYHTQQIARRVLANFLNLGTTKHGSYSADKSQGIRFLDSLQSIPKYICSVFNTAIRRLVDYNFERPDVYPELTCSRLAIQDIEAIASALFELTQGSQPLIHPNPTLETFLLERFGVPLPPEGLVESTNPSADGEGASEDGQQPRSEQPDDKQQPQQQTQSDTEQTAAPSAKLTEDMEAAIEEARLLREALDEAHRLDAVDNAIKFYNTNHYGAGPRGGQFAPKGAGGGGIPGGAGHTSSGGGRSRASGGGSARAQGHANATRSSRGGGGGGGSGAGSGHSGRATRGASETRGTKGEATARSSRARKAAKSDEELNGGHHVMTDQERAAAGLKAEARPGEALLRREGYTHQSGDENPYLRGKGEVESLKNVFGEHQLGNALSRMPRNDLVTTAREYGLKASGTKEDLVARITQHVTEGRYSGRFPKEGATTSTKAPKASGGTRSSRASKSSGEGTVAARGGKGATKEQDRGPIPVPIRHVALEHYTPYGKVDPYRLVWEYGHHQLEAVMSHHDLRGVREAVQAVKAKNPGTAPKGRLKSDMIAYIVKHVTDADAEVPPGGEGQA